MITQLKKIIIAFLPPLGWAGMIFYLSSQEVLPGFTLSIPDFILKKTAHVIVYAVLYLLALRGFVQIGWSAQKNWLTVILICLCYAMADEFHQAMVPGRSGALRDVWFDFVGISLAFVRKFGYA
jgi:VanZ family protein